MDMEDYGFLEGLSDFFRQLGGRVPEKFARQVQMPEATGMTPEQFQMLWKTKRPVSIPAPLEEYLGETMPVEQAPFAQAAISAAQRKEPISEMLQSMGIPEMQKGELSDYLAAQKATKEGGPDIKQITPSNILGVLKAQAEIASNEIESLNLQAAANLISEEEAGRKKIKLQKDILEKSAEMLNKATDMYSQLLSGRKVELEKKPKSKPEEKIEGISD